MIQKKYIEQYNSSSKYMPGSEWHVVQVANARGGKLICITAVH